MGLAINPITFAVGAALQEGVYLRRRHGWGVYTWSKINSLNWAKLYFDLDYVAAGPHMIPLSATAEDMGYEYQRPYWLQRGEVFTLRGISYTVERVFYRESVRENEAVIACHMTAYETEKAEYGEKYLQVHAELQCAVYK